MRTNPEQQRILYNWITVQEAGERLGGVSDEHVLALGYARELRITDLRKPGAKRGVYRVDPASVDRLLGMRELGGAGEAAA